MLISQAQLDRIVTAIHATPPMVVIEFAGAGAQALTWLHRVGGSSRTILEATDRYAATSLSEAIGFWPQQFTSPQVAQALARRAFRRASKLAGPHTPVAGLGCTATIATDRLKRGEHRCALTVCEAQGLTTYTLSMVKGLRSRYEEEYLVSLLILKAVADVCGVDDFPPFPLRDSEGLVSQTETVDLLARLTAGELDWVVIWPDGRLATGDQWPNLALLSGAFNPLHEGHRQLARVAATQLQQEVYFELPLVNADKDPLIDLAEVRRRVAQFADFAPVILTRLPLFSQKAQLFPNSVFILGIDTVERLTQPRFYHHNLAEMRASFEAVAAAGCRFLVAGRAVDQKFMTLQQVELPAAYHNLFEQIPEDKFRVDISSTDIRQTEFENTYPGD